MLPRPSAPCIFWRSSPMNWLMLARALSHSAAYSSMPTATSAATPSSQLAVGPGQQVPAEDEGERAHDERGHPARRAPRARARVAFIFLQHRQQRGDDDGGLEALAQQDEQRQPQHGQQARRAAAAPPRLVQQRQQLAPLVLQVRAACARRRAAPARKASSSFCTSAGVARAQLGLHRLQRR